MECDFDWRPPRSPNPSRPALLVELALCDWLDGRLTGLRNRQGRCGSLLRDNVGGCTLARWTRSSLVRAASFPPGHKRRRNDIRRPGRVGIRLYGRRARALLCEGERRGGVPADKENHPAGSTRAL